VGRGIIDSPMEWTKNCILFLHSSIEFNESYTDIIVRFLIILYSVPKKEDRGQQLVFIWWHSKQSNLTYYPLFIYKHCCVPVESTAGKEIKANGRGKWGSASH